MDKENKKLAKLRKNIVDSATAYLDIKEIGNNEGFNDSDFEKEMQLSGFRKGMPWCALFAETVWRNAYTETGLDPEPIAKTFSANSQRTFRNFEKLGMTSDKPVIGAIGIIGYGATKGHTYIVVDITPNGKVITIEGNSSDAVSKKSRNSKFDGLLGYIIPMEFKNG